MLIDFSRRRFMLTSSALIGLSLIDQKALAAFLMESFEGFR